MILYSYFLGVECIFRNALVYFDCISLCECISRHAHACFDYLDFLNHSRNAAMSCTEAKQQQKPGPVTGVTHPVCDSDGTYAPVQTDGMM